MKAVEIPYTFIIFVVLIVIFAVLFFIWNSNGLSRTDSLLSKIMENIG